MRVTRKCFVVYMLYMCAIIVSVTKIPPIGYKDSAIYNVGPHRNLSSPLAYYMRLQQPSSPANNEHCTGNNEYVIG